MSGIEIRATGQKLNHFIISQLRKDSPATKVDLQLGDEIVAINGHLTKELTLGEVNSFFRSREGRRIRLELLRDDQKMVRKIRLERAI